MTRWTEHALAKHQARRAVAPLAPLAAPANQAAPACRKRKSRAPAWQPSENDIHTALVDHLRMFARPGLHWHHPATGELRDPGTARKLARMGVRAGLPDFLLLVEGRLHGLELKRARGGRLSPKQIAMHAELIAAGAIIATAHGLDDALAKLTAWGVFKPDRKPTPSARIAA